MNNMNDDRSYSGLVEKYIGTAYDKVAKVADNLDELLNVEDVILEFYSQYYGPRTTAPTVRPDKSPIQDGDLYFNTKDQQMFYWKLDAWSALGIHTNEIETYQLTPDNFHGNVAVVTLKTPYVPGTNSMLVFKNHVYQTNVDHDPTQGSYEESNPMQITFPNGNARVGDYISLIIGTTVTTVNPIIDIIKKHHIIPQDGETHVELPDGMHYITGSHNLEVYVNGRLKILGHDYLETSPTGVTFIHGLKQGDDVLFKKGEVVSNSNPGQPMEGDVVTINHLRDLFIRRSILPHNVAIYAKGETLAGDGRSGFYLYDDTYHRSMADGSDFVDDSVDINAQGTGKGNGVWVRQYAVGVHSNAADIITNAGKIQTNHDLLDTHVKGTAFPDPAFSHESDKIIYDDKDSSLGANTVKVAIDKISHYNHFGIHAYSVKVNPPAGATGDIASDVNASDFMGHNEDYDFVETHTDLDVKPTYLHIDQHHIITFYDGNNAYRWIGRNNVNVGLGGNYMCKDTDFAHVGTGEHHLLSRRDEPDQHPIKAIGGLTAALDDRFLRADYESKFNEEILKYIAGVGINGQLLPGNRNLNNQDKTGMFAIMKGNQAPLPADFGNGRGILVVLTGASRIKQILYGIDGSSAYKIWTRSATLRTNWIPWRNTTDADLSFYDNVVSGLASTNIQDAIDELKMLSHGTGTGTGGGSAGDIAANAANIRQNKRLIDLNTAKLTPGPGYHHHNSIDVDYDNSGSGLDAINVKQAIDHIVHYNNFGIHEYGIYVHQGPAKDIVHDINTMDFSQDEADGHHIDPAFLIGTALHIDLHHVITIHDGETVYRWVGPKDVTIGLGGSHTVVGKNVKEIGTGDHKMLGNLDGKDQHPMKAIIGLVDSMAHKAAIDHTHPASAVDAYTKSEMNAKLAVKAAKTHNHTLAQITGLTTTYYSKTQTDAKISSAIRGVGGAADIINNTKLIGINKAEIAKVKALTVTNKNANTATKTIANAAKTQAAANKAAVAALKVQVGGLNDDIFIDNKENVIIGHRGTGSKITGDHNIAMGTGTLVNATGDHNVGLGYACLPKMKAGGQNIGIGWGAGFEFLSGSLNTFIGRHSAYELRNGNKNAFLGWYSGQYSNKAEQCTFIGPWAGDCSHKHAVGQGVHRNVTCIGYRSQVYADDSITLGGNGNTNGSDRIKYIFSAVSSITRRSDTRDKTDIAPIDMGLEFISKIEPVSYRLDLRSRYLPEDAADDDFSVQGDNSAHDRKDPERSIGVKAQQVEEVCQSMGVDFPGLVKTDDRAGDDLYHITYGEFIPILIQAVKDLKAEVDALKAAQA